MLQHSILRATFCYSYTASSWHNLQLRRKLRTFSKATTGLSIPALWKTSHLKFFTLVLPLRILRIQVISYWKDQLKPPPPGSSLTLVQDSLCLPQDHFFLLVSQHDRRPASFCLFCLGLVSVCILLSLRNILRSMDSMPASEHSRL